jgi:gamma-glutamylcyclotransferase (GGCT)/AIG2-like uncharacterized protein YtfP
MGFGGGTWSMDVFVYGTLTDPDRVDELLTEYTFEGDAFVEGLHRVEGTYPTLAPGGRVAGRLLRTPEIDRLDRYEGVASGLYARVDVPLAEGSEAVDGTDRSDRADTVAVYIGDPTALDASVEWPGDEPIAARADRYVRERGVRVIPDFETG